MKRFLLPPFFSDSYNTILNRTTPNMTTFFFCSLLICCYLISGALWFTRVPFIDEARRGNTQLLSAYRARMERREKQVTGSSVRRKADVTSLVGHYFTRLFMISAENGVRCLISARQFAFTQYQWISLFLHPVEFERVQKNGRKSGNRKSETTICILEY